MDLREKVKLYQKLKKKRAAHEQQAKDLWAEMESIKYELLDHMDVTGQTSFKTDFGTVYSQDKMVGKIVDKTALLSWAEENGMPDIFQSRIGSTVLKEYYEETGEYPDGLDVSYIKQVTVRKK